MAANGDAESLPTITLGPSRRFTLRDLAAVSTNDAKIELEKAAIDKLPASDLSGSGAALEAVAPRGALLSAAAARAVVVARLVSAMYGRSGVGREAAEFLAALVNRGIAPALHAGSAGAELSALVCGGASQVLSNGQPTDAAPLLSALGLPPLSKLSAKEGQALAAGAFARAGPAALEAYATSTLVATADAVAALSCEAAKACTEPFAEKHWESRQHRGQMASASNLRLLLTNSGLTKAAPEKEPDAEALAYVPQIHGPCREAIEAGVRSLELELNTGEREGDAPFHPAQVDVVASNMASAASTLARASAARLAAIRKDAAGGGIAEPSVVEAVTAVGASAFLAAELSEALGQLKALSDAAEAAAKAKEEKAKAAAPGGHGKPEESLEGMDPATRAKVEAARKAKAEKAAAKAAAKAAKAGKSVTLGQGSKELREWLDAHTGGAVDAAALAAVLCPYAASPSSSFSLFVTLLIERLGSGGAQRKPKIVKGARDFGGEEMLVREEAFGIIRSIFKTHGAQEIDTPVFELKETLTGKYGEDSKLIYDLADQGGELLSLRYDLTVPFARYLAMDNTTNLKRYHIAKVYRRDNPAINRGRFREFYQCDFDVAGAYPLMVPDSEVITVAVEILTSLPIGSFEIKLNHRRLLDSIFDICGVPAEKFRTICSAVDKLDKEPWSEVRREMTEEKGLKAQVADRIGGFVQHRGAPKELLAKLMSERAFGEHKDANAALEELRVLFDYLEALGSLPYVVFDLSLARGLDYYTGVIYEAVLTHNESQVGSIAAGGRYDNLVGMFSGTPTPCVGVSIGVERVLTIMAEHRKRQQHAQQRNAFVEVLVASIGPGLLPQRMRLAKALWKAGIPAEYLPQDNPKLKRQMEHAFEARIPFLVIVGPEELEQGVVKVKDPSKPQEESEEVVAESAMAEALVAKGARVVSRPMASFTLGEGAP